MILVLFTNSFPYDAAAEQTFILGELPYLREVFDQIILIPKACDGKKLSLNTHIDVEEGYAKFLNRRSNLLALALHAITSPYLYHELFIFPQIVFAPFKLLKLLKFSSRVAITIRWMENWLKDSQLDDRFVFYSYWFEDLAAGLGLGKRLYPQIKLVSRAHGYDIYEELYFPYYWPLRRQALAALDRLFPVSYDGRDYFRNCYPEFYDLFEAAHLGVKDPGFISSPSTDGVFRIVSCASIIPLKRIDLLLEGIAYAARRRPEQKFEWHHFGDGQARRKLQEVVKNRFPRNAIGCLPGHVPNQDVLRHYKENPVDVFVNLSTTEAVPVSIMEAISCGIPVIATGVGGNPEIVSEQNGLLLGPNPTPEDVAQALLHICDNPEITHKMREGSRKVWRESYNADVNFRAFAERLKSIGES